MDKALNVMHCIRRQKRILMNKILQMRKNLLNLCLQSCKANE